MNRLWLKQSCAVLLATLLVVLPIGPVLAQGTCSVFRSWNTGDSLTAGDLNSSFSTVGQTNMITTCVDGYSNSTAQMNLATNPNSAGSQSAATALSDELERLRFMWEHVAGFTNWWRHYQDLNFADRMVRNHLLVSTAANTRSIVRGQMTGTGETTRFHAVAFGFGNQGVHHETALMQFHVNTTTMALLLSLGGNLHIGGVLQVGAPGAASHAAIFMGAHSNTGFFWPANDAIGITIKGGTNNGGEVVRFHTGGVMAGVDNSYDIGTGAGSRFRHLHLAGAITAGGGFLFGAGTAGAPSVTTTANTNTGFFWPATNAVAASIGGAEVARIHAGGLMAGVNNSYDIGTVSGSQFRHMHMSGALFLSSPGTANVGFIGLTAHASSFTPHANALYASTIPKGWINFDGTGTIKTQAAFNIASLTDNAAGDYTINVSRAFSSGNYGFASMVISPNIADSASVVVHPTVAPTSSAFRIQVLKTSNGGATDLSMISVVFFGDQ